MTKKMFIKVSICLWIVILVLVGCSSTGGIELTDAWARPGGGHGMVGDMQGANSAVYMVIRNHSANNDVLLMAESDIAEAVELHKSEMKDGIMTMNPVESIEIPAGGQVELAPGGLHIMLIGLKKELKTGEKFTITLVFEKAGKQTIDILVK